MKKSGIYLITNLINEKKYVGQSVDISRRWWVHANGYEKSLISSAIKKYGKNNFSFQILIELDNIDDMNLLEPFFIKHYNSLSENGQGYNIKVGGKNSPQSQSTKLKISKANKGKYKGLTWNEKYGLARSLAIKSKLKKSMKGRIAWNKGISQTFESNQKRSNSIKKLIENRKKQNPELEKMIQEKKSKSMKLAWLTGKKNSNNMKGIKKSIEHKKKLSQKSLDFYSSLTKEELLEKNCNKLRRCKKGFDGLTNSEIIKIFHEIHQTGLNDYQFDKKIVKKIQEGSHWSNNYFS